jgi:ABC-type amino acid transport substrate-binding protein
MGKFNKTQIGIAFVSGIILVILVQLWLWLRAETEIPPPKTYTIARDATWFPLEFLGKSRQVAAFSDELLAAISKEQNIHFRIYSSSSSLLFPGLHAKTFQGVLSADVPRGTLLDNYVSSVPYFRFGPVLVVRKASKITQLEQLSGSAVGVLRGASLLFDEAGSIDITYIPYDNVLVALQHLSDGVVDGVIIDAFPAYAYTNSLFADRLQVASAPLTNEALRLIALKGYEGRVLIQQFDEGLEALKNNGTYTQLLKKWGLFNADVVAP